MQMKRNEMEIFRTHQWKCYPKDCQLSIKTAEDCISHRFIFNQRWDMEMTYEYVEFPKEIDFLHIPKDDPEWLYQFNRLRHFISFGEAYVLTGDEKYAKAFSSQFLLWFRSVRPNDKMAMPAWRTIEAGIRLDNIIKAYMLMKDSPEVQNIRDDFMHSVKEHAAFILENSWNSYHLMSNWGVLSNHGLYVAGVFTKNVDWQEEALRRLEIEMDNQVYDDGMQWEQSPMYHCEVARDFFDVILLSAKTKVKPSKAFVDKARRMAYVNAFWLKPDGHLPLMGDTDDIDARDLVSRSAYIFKDGMLKYCGYKTLDYETAFHVGMKGVLEYEAIKQRKPRTEMFLSDSGNIFSRTSWQRNASYLRFHNGTLGAGHGHADQGHISFVFRGRDFLVDAGRYSYVFGPKRVAFKNHMAHNTIIVDDKQLYPEKDSWECYSLNKAVNTSFCAKDGYVAMQGGHLGYYSDGVFVNRKVLWLKDADLLVVCDELFAKGHHDYRQVFHFAEGLDAEIDENKAIIGDVPMTVVSTCGVQLTKGSGAISRHYNQKKDNIYISTAFAADDFASVFTVFDFSHDRATITPLEVKSSFKGITFSSETIEALSVKSVGRDFVLVFAHEEYATPTDTFSCGGCVGFGSLTVFDKGREQTEVGTRLFC